MFVKIIKVFNLSTREYTDRQGTQQTFVSKGFILSDGRNTFFAEALQELARTVDALGFKEGDYAIAHFVFQAREYTTKDGVVRYSNEITINGFLGV